MAIVVVEQGDSNQHVQMPKVNFRYFITPPGIAKLVQFVVGIVVFIISAFILLEILNYILFILCVAWIFIYIFSLQQRLAVRPPWIVLEFYYTCGAAVLYLLTTIIAFIVLSWISAALALVNTIAYGAGAYFLHKDWRTWRANPDAAVTGPK